jgi:hypothetical protein
MPAAHLIRVRPFKSVFIRVLINPKFRAAPGDSMTENPPRPDDEKSKPEAEKPAVPPAAEKDGPKRPDPTRYQDWEKGGRCIDF